MTPNIREATLADAEELQRYAARLFTEHLPGIYRRAVPTLEEEHDFIRAHTEPERSIMLLAEADGQVVGLLGFLARQLPQESHVGAFGISVDRDYRGNGIGSALIEALIEWAPRQGIRRIEVEAFAINERAIHLYEHLGFKQEGRRRSAVIIEDKAVDVIFLARILTA